VDLFVNYDCSLQAANLYERTVKAVRRLMQLAEPNPLFSAAVTQVRALQTCAAQAVETQQAQAKPRQQACVLFGVCCLQ
jgi:phosphoglycerate-specific signal transduction histidine kinase